MPEERMNEIVVSVSIYPGSEADVVKGVEVLSRAAAGLALEGINVSINLTDLSNVELDDD